MQQADPVTFDMSPVAGPAFPLEPIGLPAPQHPVYPSTNQQGLAAMTQLSAALQEFVVIPYEPAMASSPLTIPGSEDPSTNAARRVALPDRPDYVFMVPKLQTQDSGHGQSRTPSTNSGGHGKNSVSPSKYENWEISPKSPYENVNIDEDEEERVRQKGGVRGSRDDEDDGDSGGGSMGRSFGSAGRTTFRIAGVEKPEETQTNPQGTWRYSSHQVPMRKANISTTESDRGTQVIGSFPPVWFQALKQ